MAQKHCSACHQLPSPDLLDKETWASHVLPAMASNLGIEAYPGGQYYAGRSAVLSYENWQKLIAYYQTLAPEKLKEADRPEPAVDNWAAFSLEKPREDTTQTAITTMVAIDTLGHQLYSSDAIRADITQWNQGLQPTPFTQLVSPAVNATFFGTSTGQNELPLPA